MMNWLLRKISYWISEKVSRKYQQLNTRRLEENRTKLPKDLQKIDEVLSTLNDNSWAVFHLFKRARKNEQNVEAFSYFIYSFELTLKHMIISEMHLRNLISPTVNNDHSDYFTLYSEEKMINVLDLGMLGKLVEEFLVLFPDFQNKENLRKIVKERNDIIHNMLKKKMSEKEIEESFKIFFKKSLKDIAACMQEFDSILAKRPKNILEDFIKLNS